MSTPPLPAPSKNQSDQHTMPGMLDAVFKKQMQGTHGQLPAKVLSYDRVRNIAVVQPLIMVLQTNGQTVSRAQIAEVPVLALGGGGYVLNFPLKKNDLGWIEASDRDISLFLQAHGEAQPNTARLHSFEDGRFVPDAFAQYVIEGEDAAAVVLQSLDGSVRIAIDAAGVRIIGPAIRADCQTFTINAAEGVVINTPVIDMGAATITGTGDLEFDGIKFGTHEHPNGTLPSGKSGGPVNP